MRYRVELHDYRLGALLAIKGINKLKKAEPAPPPPGPSPEAKLLTEIRDILKK